MCYVCVSYFKFFFFLVQFTPCQFFCFSIMQLEKVNRLRLQSIDSNDILFHYLKFLLIYVTTSTYRQGWGGGLLLCWCMANTNVIISQLVDSIIEDNLIVNVLNEAFNAQANTVKGTPHINSSPLLVIHLPPCLIYIFKLLMENPYT